MTLPRRIAWLLLSALTIALALPTAAQAATAKKVVALEWEYVEDLLALGIKPVGAADLKGMRTWTAISVPSSVKDVGTRQEPSLERIAALEPDLIVAPRFRTARNLDELRRIAPVLQLDAYPEGKADAHYQAMVKSLKEIAKRVGKRAQGDTVVRNLERTYTKLRAQLKKKGLDGDYVTLGMGGGTESSPQARLFTDNSLAAGVLRRLGLKNGWTKGSQPFGFSEVGIEALRDMREGYLVFAYPEMAANAARRIQQSDAWKNLDVVRNKRVRAVAGNTWPYGGPLSTKVLAERVAGALTK